MSLIKTFRRHKPRSSESIIDSWALRQLPNATAQIARDASADYITEN